MMENKNYNEFIRLLNFKPEKYSNIKVFSDFVTLYAISISNKIQYNKQNARKYAEIYNSYAADEHCNFYALGTLLTKMLCSQTEPYDILGEIYKEISQNNYLKLVRKQTPMQEVGKKLQGVMNINQKNSNGKMVEIDCGSGAMILAYASILKLFKLDYKIDLEVTATDTDLLNVFMTYIQLYFYEISATVMRLYTFLQEDAEAELLVA